MQNFSVLTLKLTEKFESEEIETIVACTMRVLHFSQDLLNFYPISCSWLSKTHLGSKVLFSRCQYLILKFILLKLILYHTKQFSQLINQTHLWKMNQKYKCVNWLLINNTIRVVDNPIKDLLHVILCDLPFFEDHFKPCQHQVNFMTQRNDWALHLVYTGLKSKLLV